VIGPSYNEKTVRASLSGGTRRKFGRKPTKALSCVSASHVTLAFGSFFKPKSCNRKPFVWVFDFHSRKLSWKPKQTGPKKLA
jgi:hypothetical protein